MKHQASGAQPTNDPIALTVRLAPAAIEQLDRLVEETRSKVPGAHIGRGAIARVLVLRGLERDIDEREAAKP
jgi:hypothetical protein